MNAGSLSCTSLCIFLATTLTISAQQLPALATPPSASLNARARLGSRQIPEGCPNYFGPLNSVGVPVDGSQELVVLSAPAPAGGITWDVYSSNPSIVAAGNATQGFIPQVFTPEGQTYSTPFTLYGVAVGETTDIIQEISPGSSTTSTPVTAWAVNPGGYSSFLDANFPSNSCRSEGSASISADPNILATCGENVETQTADGFDYGFSFYQAPAAYDDTADSRQVEIEFAFAPNIGNSNTTFITTTLSIIRTPVVLIHGLWSDPKTAWPSLWYRDYPNATTAANYQATNASNFSVNYPSVQTFVANGLQSARDLGYAASQVDVVAHSMGGILTRLYAGTTAFHRPDNFNLGDIRRLVTLDTPHFGASLANLIISLNANAPLAVSSIGSLGNFFRSLGFDDAPIIYEGAICDLAENSPALEGLSSGTNLPSQVITATGGPAGTPRGGLYYPLFEKALTAQYCFPLSLLTCLLTTGYIFPQDIVNDFRFRQANDTIVPVSSQQGGLAGTNFPNYIHTNVTGGQDVAFNAFTLLDSPGSSFIAGLPAVPSNGLGNPLTVPGRGTALDQADYKSQCVVANAPLNPQTHSTNAQAKKEAMADRQRNGGPRLTADARVQVIAPTAGQQFAPGQTVDITVQLSAGLTAIAGFVDVAVPGLGRLVGTNYNGTTYQASFVIPTTFTGPIILTPVIFDAINSPVGGVSISVNAVPTSAPASISILGGNYVHYTSVPTLDAIGVEGNYPGGLTLDLSSSVTGTTYSSSNTAVLTVDANGNVQAAAFGTAVVTVRNNGLTAFLNFVVENPYSPLPPQDVTNELAISLSGLQLNRTTGFYVQTATLENSFALPIAGPLYLVLVGLPNGVTFTTAPSGLTQTIAPVGSPYMKLQLPSGLTIPPGTSISVPLQFLNPGRSRIGYTPKVLRFSGTP
jgi:pimeloyl-ACP methyl ester carboxylesterase